MLTVTDVVEYVFCKRFTYYTLVMGLRQFEEKRGTVLAGRAFHERHERENRSYVSSRIEGKKMIGLMLYSEKLGLVGKVDEVIDTGDELVLIERKYSDYAEVRDTLKVQLGLLAVLLEENLGKRVTQAKVIFTKEKWKESKVMMDPSLRSFALRMLGEAHEVVDRGTMPEEEPDGRCLNCCFRKICTVGFLYTEE